MRSLFALAFITPAALAASAPKKPADGHGGEEEAEQVGPVIPKSEWHADFHKTKLKAKGEYWSVAGNEGKHMFVIDSVWTTDYKTKLKYGDWFFTSFAI